MNMGESLQALTVKLLGWGRDLVLNLPNLLIAVVVVAAFWFASRLVRSVVERILGRISHNPTVSRLLASTASLAVFATGVFIALGILKLDKTVMSLLAGAGIAALVLGFAFQDIAANMMAGILLSVRQPFRPGHLVELLDFMGIVEEVNLRFTVIRTLQGQIVYLPNKEVLGHPIMNFSLTHLRRIDLVGGVSYADDLEAAKRLAIEAVQDVPRREPTRAVEFFYEDFGDSQIAFVVRIWIQFEKQTDYLEARSEAIRRLKAAFDAGGVTIPFPIRTLDFGAKGGETLAHVLAAAPTLERRRAD